MGSKLYVGNLAGQTTASDLMELFAGAGQVISAQIITDRETGRSKGFAFIEMADEMQSRQAIALYSGHLLYDQALVVNEARPRETRPGRTANSGSPRFREIKHKRRDGGHLHRFR